MKIVKKIGIGLVALLALLALIGFILPRKAHVERSVVINAPQEEIFARVDELKRWKDWSPWYAKEPTVEQTFSGPDRGVGSKMAWSGKITGKGTQEITVSEWPTAITTKLGFEGQGDATSDWKFVKEGSGTKVTWGFECDMGLNPVGRFFGLMMDSMLGPDYEAGLAKLKEVSEKDAFGQGGKSAPEMPVEEGGDNPAAKKSAPADFPEDDAKAPEPPK